MNEPTWDRRTSRYIGPGVPAYCDHPDCVERITRGPEHQSHWTPEAYVCANHAGTRHANPATTPEHPTWLAHIHIHDTWRQWRQDNHALLERWQESLAAGYARITAAAQSLANLIARATATPDEPHHDTAQRRAAAMRAEYRRRSRARRRRNR